MGISTMQKTAGAALAATLAAASLAGAAAPAQAQTLIPGVTGCSASGNKQATGAVLGAVAGGLLGNRIADDHRTTGTVVGAAAGAAAGSAVGCQMQKNDEQQRAEQAAPSYRESYREHGGYRLNPGVAPASYREMNERLVATSTVNLRAAPRQSAAKVGQLRRGERFEAMAEVRGTDWLLVGRNGVGIGYVHGAYVRSDGYRTASY